MSFIQRRRFLRVKINGSIVRTSEDVGIAESLDQLCTVCTFQLAQQPGNPPVASDVVTVELVAADLSRSWFLFGGKINNVQVESEPWTYAITAVDQLELLRATKKFTDMDLTGKTDGEAWMAIADYCGLIYEPGDICDYEYVLGVHEPILWHADASTTAGAMIDELDSVFGTATMCVGNNRIVRFGVDFTPEADSALYATWEKGYDATFAQNTRNYGDRDVVQNVWKVTGATAQLDDTCTATPYATASDGNAQIGRRTRTAEQSFSSDLIQDVALSEVIARRLMRRYNRIPDRASVTVENDANIHPGAVIKLVDSTYGIDTGSNKRYLVEAVSRSGLSMSLDLNAGPGGDEGTVATGVDKVCGDSHTDPGWDPGDYAPGDPSGPPIDDGTSEDSDDLFDDRDPIFVADTAGKSGDECVEPDPLELCNVETFVVGIDLEADGDWEITGTLNLSDDDDEAVAVGATSDDGDYTFRIAAPGFYDPTVGSFAYELRSPAGNSRFPGAAPLETDIAYSLRWLTAAKRLSLYATVGDDYCFDDSVDNPDATMIGAETIRTLTNTPSVVDQVVSHDCGNYTGGGGGTGGTDGTSSCGDYGGTETMSGSPTPGSPANQSTVHENMTAGILQCFRLEGTLTKPSDRRSVGIKLQETPSGPDIAALSIISSGPTLGSGKGQILFTLASAGIGTHTFGILASGSYYSGDFPYQIDWDAVAQTVRVQIAGHDVTYGPGSNITNTPGNLQVIVGTTTPNVSPSESANGSATIGYHWMVP